MSYSKCNIYNLGVNLGASPLNSLNLNLLSMLDDHGARFCTAVKIFVQSMLDRH